MRPAVGFMLYNANNLNISLQAGLREKLSLVEIIRRDLHNFIQHVMLVGLVVGWSVDQWSVSPRWDAPRQRSSARSAAWKKLRDKERHPLCLSVPSLMQPGPAQPFVPANRIPYKPHSGASQLTTNSSTDQQIHRIHLVTSL